MQLYFKAIAKEFDSIIIEKRSKDIEDELLRIKKKRGRNLLDKKYIQKCLDFAQQNCKARVLDLHDILNFKKKSEKMAKKIKRLNLEEEVEIYFEAYQGLKKSGFKYLNTCVYGYFDVDGNLNEIKINRDKKAYSVFRITIPNYHKLNKKTKEILRDKFNCTEYGYHGYINL